ncbi:alpha/beta fold hydrolase, partial [Thiolapillus sp.]
DSRRTLRRFLSLQVQGAADAKDLLLRLRREFDSRPLPNPAALQTGLDILLHSDLRRALATLDLPSAWLLGERDTLVPKSLAHALTGLQPQAEVHVIDGAAHAPFLSHPGQCLKRLEAFIRHV